MLRSVKNLKNFKLRTRDGDLGKVREFYFDDKYWTVRYLIAETNGWLSGRRVLISPYALQPANEAEELLPVDLTMEQIEKSPSLASDEPVSRQYERLYHDYYNWPMYWGGPFMWGSTPRMMRNVSVLHKADLRREEAWDPNLRSTNDVTGHNIQAQDGEIGHVEDFIIDDEIWAIRYMVVDTKNWWPGKHVLVAPQWIDQVSWEESKVFVSLTREIIERSPEYVPESLNREYETALHQHYHRPGYWIDEPSAAEPAEPADPE